MSSSCGSNTRSPWLLVQGKYCGSHFFICSADTRGSIRDQGDLALNYDFKDVGSLSYSYANSSVRVQTEGSGGNVPPWRMDDPGRAIMADRTPLTKATSSTVDIVTLNLAAGLGANSPNHKSEGQNVMYIDAHVKWCNNPRVGVKDDNIWTRNNLTSPDGILRSYYDWPLDSNDSMLVP